MNLLMNSLLNSIVFHSSDKTQKDKHQNPLLKWLLLRLACCLVATKLFTLNPTVEYMISAADHMQSPLSRPNRRLPPTASHHSLQFKARNSALEVAATRQSMLTRFLMELSD
jgi:hypothetical protein